MRLPEFWGSFGQIRKRLSRRQAWLSPSSHLSAYPYNIPRIFFARSNHERWLTLFFLWYFFTDTSCGGVYEDGSGTISSPGYPNGYADSLDCVWLVYRTTETAEYIFTDFATESGYDTVAITSGRWLQSILIFCETVSIYGKEGRAGKILNPFLPKEVRQTVQISFFNMLKTNTPCHHTAVLLEWSHLSSTA